jgi:hypothetical protein
MTPLSPEEHMLEVLKEWANTKKRGVGELLSPVFERLLQLSGEDQFSLSWSGAGNKLRNGLGLVVPEETFIHIYPGRPRVQIHCEDHDDAVERSGPHERAGHGDGSSPRLMVPPRGRFEPGDIELALQLLDEVRAARWP